MTQQQIANVVRQLQIMSIVPRLFGWSTHRCFDGLKELVDELRAINEVDIVSVLAVFLYRRDI